MKKSAKSSTAQGPGGATPRNIAIFIDGTWNTSGTTEPTNVEKLCKAVPEGIINGREQFRLYLSGVGEEPRAEMTATEDEDYAAALAIHLNREMPRGTGRARGAIGGMFGKGTKARIEGAYHYLCSHFDRERGDQVYMFGFSRGAFAARSLAGFVSFVGLLLADKLEHVQRAYELYEKYEDPTHSELSEFLYKLTKHSSAGDGIFSIPTHFLGVWDTVASLGLPSRMASLTAPHTEYHQVGVPPLVMTARHALALHELRGLFEPLLWKPGTHRDLKQVWFSGAHCDVGGGYEVGQDGLSDIALRWMADEAMACGLSVDLDAAWRTRWDTRPSVHHQIRDVFLATFPSTRGWLDSDLNLPHKSHYFHRSAVNYLSAADQVKYKFLHPFVNSALRRVDALALQRALLLRLHGREIVE